MTRSSGDRSRRVAAAVSVLTVIAVVGAVILALGVGLPDAWWPHTGQAFAADTPTDQHDPCTSIVGPAKTYCERGATTTAVGQQDMAAAVWRLVAAGAGVAALMVWRLRHTSGQRRR
ncbi:hypothetical protein OG713_45805 (plasmid) [Streptomyces sp. NBC_00723]|uniref:hypothetical protein n=1 Tax=Streptomyces sp. NBC_00723 TaxID=2903673 RepID=UPI002F913DBE